MAQLNVKLTEDQLEALRRYAVRRRTPVSWLIKDYVQYLLSGGQPPTPNEAELPTHLDLAAVAQRGGAFDWLSDEPDLHSLDDGVPVAVLC
jgi:hypothetical protein